MIKPLSLIIMSWFYIAVGISHITDPNWFLQIVPPYLPFKLELVYVSGFFEIIFGFMLILPCLLYTSPSPRDATLSRMPSSA